MHLYVQRDRKKAKGLALTVAVFLLLLALFVAAVLLTGDSLRAQQEAMLLESLRSAAVTCFAVEGRYPPTLAYLCDEYGVTYDSGRFYVMYASFASNIMPDIEVLKVGVGAL